MPKHAALRRLLVALALAPACSIVNNDHCANLEGDATCKQRDPERPFCSQCLADNNGCFSEAPEDSCHAVTVAPPASTSDASTTTLPNPSSSTAPTSTGSHGGTQATTSSTSEPAVTSSSTSEPDTSSSSSSSDTTETTTSSTGDTTTTTTDTASTSSSDTSDTGSDTSSSTGDAPVCGDAMIEGDEVCDGNQLDSQTCKKLLPSKWGGGTLKCTKTCKSFDDTDCCIGASQACNYLLKPDELCCPGLTCVLGQCKVQ